MDNETKQNKDTRQQLYFSIVLALIAIVSATMATVAWFSIANRTKVQSMRMEITSGTWLRFDLDEHKTFEDYIKTLTFADIRRRIQKDLGYDLTQVPLQPVTTTDCQLFTLHNGREVKAETGAYLEFTLHFWATKDMNVHLTSADSAAGILGTSVSSENPKLPDAMRISFTIGDTSVIYDPGMGATSVVENDVKNFGLPAKADMKYNSDNKLFFIKANQDLPVIVHIWMEGNDPACNDELRGTDYSIRLRFQGTDEKYQPFEDNE